MKILKFALLGVGRIGKMHAANIALNPNCKIEYVFDINHKISQKVANQFDCKSAQSAEEAITNSNIDVVYISSATPTHIDYILLAAKNGKAIFCEKPIDLDIKKIDECKKDLENYKVPIQIGFNRRFDQNHKSAKQAKDTGKIGTLEKIIITSRDPSPPSKEYLKDCGGMFKDMTIHDFDLTRFILNNDPVDEVFATGSALFDNNIKTINDIDTAMIIMRSRSGVLCHINNSRRAVYGYDQRIEIFGSKGMVISNNQTPTSVQQYTKSISEGKDPIHYFFIERYDNAYKMQLKAFVDCILNNKPVLVDFEDGRNAMIIANAAYESLASGKLIKINYS